MDVAAGYANDGAAAEEQAARISRMGRWAMAVRSDVSDSAAVEEMVDKVEAEFESVDILISNAGIALQQSLDECRSQVRLPSGQTARIQNARVGVGADGVRLLGRRLYRRYRRCPLHRPRRPV